MVISDMEELRLMVYVQQVKEGKLRNREEYRNKKVKTRNESRQQKSGSSRPRFHKYKGHAPSYANAPTLIYRGEYNGRNSQNLKARPIQSKVVWHK